MHPSLWNLEAWDALSEHEMRAVALEVEAVLGPVRGLEHWGEPALMRFALHDIAPFACGDQARSMARFVLGTQEQGGGRLFCLVPGGQVELGLRQDSTFPNEEHKRDYESLIALGFWPPLQEFLAQTTTPPRSVELEPFLIEAQGLNEESWGWAEVRDALRGSGLRLPSGDEWERAYAGGTRELLPWGSLEKHDEAPWDAEGGLHNGFGLRLEHKKFGFYYHELSSQSGMVRGGDGGCAACGGYRGKCLDIIESAPWAFPYDGEMFENGHFRRAISVPTAPR